MKSNLIIFLIVMMLIVLVLYLFYSSGVFDTLFRYGRRCRKKVESSRERKKIQVVKGPEINLKEKGARKYYRAAAVESRKFTIGRSEKCDLVLDSPTVEEEHAVIVKKQSDGGEYFELRNCGKVNPIYHYNAAKDKYLPMKYKKTCILEAPRQYFYIGSYKVEIVIPSVVPISSDTERLNREAAEAAAFGGPFQGAPDRTPFNVSSEVPDI